MNITTHQEKKKNEEANTGKRKPGEERKQVTDFKKLCAALLQSFREQHGEKMKGSAGAFGKANSHFGPTQTGSGAAPPC